MPATASQLTRPFDCDLLFFVVCRSQTGNGAGCLCDDCREGGETLSHDDDQEPVPD